MRRRKWTLFISPLQPLPASSLVVALALVGSTPYQQSLVYFFYMAKLFFFFLLSLARSLATVTAVFGFFLMMTRKVITLGNFQADFNCKIPSTICVSCSYSGLCLGQLKSCPIFMQDLWKRFQSKKPTNVCKSHFFSTAQDS